MIINTRYIMYKVNFDGAVDNDANRSGIGVVIRNTDAEVMGTYAAGIRWISEPRYGGNKCSCVRQGLC